MCWIYLFEQQETYDEFDRSVFMWMPISSPGLLHTWFWFNETCQLHDDLRLFSMTLSSIWWHMYYHSQHFSMPVLFSGWQTKYIVSIISSGFFFFKLYRFWLIAYFIQSVFHDPYRLLDGLLFVGLNDSPFLFIVGCDTVIKRPYLKGKP